MPLEIKIFIGVQKNAKLNFQLKKNACWEQEEIANLPPLKHVHHEGKDFLGLFLDQDLAPIEDIDKSAKIVKDKIEQYLGESLDNYPPIVIFSQFFIG